MRLHIPKLSDFKKARARDCPSNLMNAIGLSKQGDRVSSHWVGAINVTLVAEKLVSLISFSGQSLALLMKESLSLRYKNKRGQHCLLYKWVKLFINVVLLTLFITAIAYAHECDLSDPRSAIKQSKDALRKDRWDASVQACLALAYYKIGDHYWAMKVLKDAEEHLPQWVINQIHHWLWTESPELLAIKEYSNQYTMSGGDCIIKNTSMIDGNGYLIIGDFFNPHSGQIMRHLASHRCDREFRHCRESNLVCPACRLERPEAVIKVRDYGILEVYPTTPAIIDRNLRYIKTVLELQRERHAR